MTNCRGPLFVLAGSLCYSTSGFAQAVFVADGASPLLTGAIRMVIGGLALTAWCACTGRLPRREGWPPLTMALCCLCMIGYQLFFFRGVLVAGVATGTIVTIGTVPLAAAGLAAIFLKERPAPIWYPATVLAIAGVVLLNWSDGALHWDKMTWPVLAALSYAVYLVACKPLTRRHRPETILMVLLLASGAILAPLAAHSHPAWLVTPKGFAYMLHLGIVTAAGGYLFSLKGLQSTPTATAGTLGLSEPLCSMCLGFFCLGEPMTPMALAGITCILTGALALILLPASGTRQR